MYNTRSISSKDLTSLDYPLLYREEESLELSELYDAEVDTRDHEATTNQESVLAGKIPNKPTGSNPTSRQPVHPISISKPRVVSPIATNPALTIDENVDLYHSDLQKVVNDIDAYASIIDNPNLSAQDIPRLCVEELDMEVYRNKFTAKKDLSIALIQQAVELRKKTSQVQSLLETLCTQSLGEKMGGGERPSKSDADAIRTAPIYDRLLPITQPPIYEQNCRVIWSSSESFVLLSHIKHSSDTGTDVFAAHIDTELSRFQQDCKDDISSNKCSTICTLTLWFRKQGNQLLLRFLCDEYLKTHRPTLHGHDSTISAEPKYIREKCSLSMLGAALGLKQPILHDMLQLTFKDISSNAAKEVITITSDIFQRFYAQLQIWGALRAPTVVFMTYYQACPRFFASKSDKLVNFLASQTIMEPELKILSTKSTTLQTFPGNCLYFKLYVAQSLESVIVRLSFQQDSDNRHVLSFTAFKFSSGETVSDDDVRAILSSADC